MELPFCTHLKVRCSHGIWFALFVSWYLKIVFCTQNIIGSWFFFNTVSQFLSFILFTFYNYWYYYVRSILFLFVLAIVLFLYSFFALFWVTKFLILSCTSTNGILTISLFMSLTDCSAFNLWLPRTPFTFHKVNFLLLSMKYRKLAIITFHQCHHPLCSHKHVNTYIICITYIHIFYNLYTSLMPQQNISSFCLNSYIFFKEKGKGGENPV